MSNLLSLVSNCMILGKLKEIKAEKRLTNQIIADRSGVPLSTVIRIFNGQTDNPNIQTIEDIANGMGVSLDAITGIKQVEEKFSPDDNLIQIYNEIIKNKDKWIKFLAISLISILVIIVALLFVDLMVHDIGYIRH